MADDELTGRQKAAILMVAMGIKGSSLVMRELPEEEIEIVSREIANLGQVTPETIHAIEQEFREMAAANEFMGVGGIDYAVQILQETMGSNRAMSIIRKVQHSMDTDKVGFQSLHKLDPDQLLTFVQNEHPQTIALVLTRLEPQQAAYILSRLADDVRNEVVLRFATMERVSYDMIREVEEVIGSRVEVSSRGSQIGGVRATAEVLNRVGQTIEKAIFTKISEKNPALAEEIKNLMFVFEDIVLLDDRSIQRFLREVRTQELGLALKSCSAEVKKRILSNMSERAQTMIEEEIAFMGPVRLRDVEQAQKQVVDAIRRLEEQGEIVISAPGEKEEILV